MDSEDSAVPDPKVGQRDPFYDWLNKGCWGMAIVGFVILTFLIFFQRPHGIPDKAKEAEVKQNLYSIHLAVEKYGVAHEGNYPASVSDLLAGQDWMDNLPSNPFAKPKREMQVISFGAEEPWGDFTYLPVEKDGVVVGYYLLAYGSERTHGMYVDDDDYPDYVIIVLSSEDRNTDDILNPNEKYGDLPPLASLLAEQK